MIEFDLELNEILDLNLECVLIRVVSTKGSAPRDNGAFMLVNELNFFGTIGGGNLEYHAVKTARNFINDLNFTASLSDYKLGPALGQCCGGEVKLSFERVTPKLKNKLLKDEQAKKNSLSHILVFGAGHVGQSLFQQLKRIPFNVSIFDSRPLQTLDFQLPLVCKTTAFPEVEVRNAKPNSAYVILTHDHSLDFILVKEALKRADSPYVGMIGSKSKKAVLKSWLEKEGVNGFDKVFTPLGASVTNLKGLDKEPSVIASLIIVEILVAFQIYKNKC